MTPPGPGLPDLSRIPCLGWVPEASPVTSLDALARELGLGSLWVKRDDQIGALHGGTKVRKLDYLLATQEAARAGTLVSVGAVGSGHLVALAAAGRELDKGVEAHCFWEPMSAEVLDNLAFTASSATLCFHRSRVGLAARHPRLVWPGAGALSDGVIPPGASHPVAVMGLVRAGLELGQQVHAGLCPAPSRVYVALGTGGTAAGLAVGLAMAGLSTEVHAVGTVEPWILPAVRARGLARATVALLRRSGVELSDGFEAVPIVGRRGFLGAGYACPTPAGRAAAARVAPALDLELVYTAKAMACLLADAAAGGLSGSHVMFWQTNHRPDIPHDDDWMTKLPSRLARRVEGRHVNRWRRRLLVGGAAAAVSWLGWYRLLGPRGLVAWSGSVLSARQAAVLVAALPAVLPPAPDEGLYSRVALAVDRFLARLPLVRQRDVRMMLGFVEQATLAAGHLRPFTDLSVRDRTAFLEGLSTKPGMVAQVYRGLRDLCYLGYYQQPETWKALGYGGPWKPADGPRPTTPYDDLIAPAGSHPGEGQ